MSKINVAAVIALGCLAAGACAGKRYPMAPAWSVAEGQAMSCGQLRQAQAAARDIERRIQLVGDAPAGVRLERPVLYSMARPDAERAVQARLDGIETALRSANCPS